MELQRFCLDTNILGMLCNPRLDAYPELKSGFQQYLLREDIEFFIPEIVDYELRRKLLHLAYQQNQILTRSLKRLDQLTELLSYLPLTTAVMRDAAHLWAQARSSGLSTASPEAMDGDIILAAQARAIGATVITTNQKHLMRFVTALQWQEIQTD
jgi:predicted nucleic acid-binding protein